MIRVVVIESVFNFMRNCQIDFQSGCTILNTYPQYIMVSRVSGSHPYFGIFCCLSLAFSGCGVIAHCGSMLYFCNDQ